MDDISRENITRLKAMGDFWFEQYGEAAVALLLDTYEGLSLDRIDADTACRAERCGRRCSILVPGARGWRINSGEIAMHVSGLVHININCTDYDRSLPSTRCSAPRRSGAFRDEYARGRCRWGMPPYRVKGAILTLQDTDSPFAIDLLEWQSPRDEAPPTNISTAPASRLYGTNDLAADYAHLQAQGVEIIAPPAEVMMNDTAGSRSSASRTPTAPSSSSWSASRAELLRPVGLENGGVDGREVEGVAHLQMRRPAQAVERAGHVRAVDLVHRKPAVPLIGHLPRRKPIALRRQKTRDGQHLGHVHGVVPPVELGFAAANGVCARCRGWPWQSPERVPGHLAKCADQDSANQWCDPLVRTATDRHQRNHGAPAPFFRSSGVPGPRMGTNGASSIAHPQRARAGFLPSVSHARAGTYGRDDEHSDLEPMADAPATDVPDVLSSWKTSACPAPADPVLGSMAAVAAMVMTEWAHADLFVTVMTSCPCP